MEDVYECQASVSGITSIQYEYTGKVFAVAAIDGNVLIIDMETFAKIGFFDLSPGPLTQIAWGNDCSTIFVGDGRGNINKLDINTKKASIIYSNSFPITSIASCRTQFGVAAGLSNGEIVLLYNSLYQTRKINAHDALISSICFHDCGFMIISSDINGCIRIWDITTLKCIKSIMINNSFINSLCLSDKQDVILASSTANFSNDGLLTLYSLPDFEKISQFSGFKSDRVLMQCGFTSVIHNETYIFSPNTDGDLQFWKIGQKDENPIISAVSQEGVYLAVSASTANPFLVTGGGPKDGFFRVFKIHINNECSDESND